MGEECPRCGGKLIFSDGANAHDPIWDCPICYSSFIDGDSGEFIEVNPKTMRKI